LGTRVLVPDLGDFDNVEVIEVLVQPGETVALEAPLLTLETEKATMDVPSTVAGRVSAVLVKKGDHVSSGTAVVEIDADPSALQNAAVKAAPQPLPATAALSPTLMPIVAPVAQAEPVVARPATDDAVLPVATLAFDVGNSRAHASPSVRLLARELGVDLSRVAGTGLKGRVLHTDVKAWVKQSLSHPAPAAAALPSVPIVDFAKFGSVSTVPLSRVQKISGARLHASWVNVPHVTQFDEADITAMDAARQKLKEQAAAAGIKLTPLVFIVRACVQVLAQYPRFNASLDATGNNLVLKNYLHLGFAADTPNGLMVPVVRDANTKGLFSLARDLAALALKARDGKLTAAEMQGGSFTVSSLGGIGGTAFTPIINAPEVAILGVSRASLRPTYVQGTLAPRLMLPLSLSYDHRVIDGAQAARFTTALAAALGNVESLIGDLS